MKNQAHLVLKDGFTLSGDCFFDLPEPAIGEIVFATSMSGYVEILTDPSYFGQIVVLSYPEIGNYGVNLDDFQSDGIKVKGLVVRNLSRIASSHRSHMTLLELLHKEKIPVLFGVDTRALISHVREKGSMLAAMAPAQSRSASQLYDEIQIQELPSTRWSTMVCVKKPTHLPLGYYQPLAPAVKSDLHIVVMDFGVKRSILRHLNAYAHLTLVPGDTPVEEIWAQKPDGVFLSNGPGDPQTEKAAISTVRSLLGKVPLFGVCLGHQILALALGYSTYKLKFGHRGSNQAVRTNDHTIITTAQNHGFAAEIPESKTSLVNISDGTNEGLLLPEQHAFSVQFHPEGSPGPADAEFYFEKFITTIEKWKASFIQTAYAEVR